MADVGAEFVDGYIDSKDQAERRDDVSFVLQSGTGRRQCDEVVHVGRVFCGDECARGAMGQNVVFCCGV